MAAAVVGENRGHRRPTTLRLWEEGGREGDAVEERGERGGGGGGGGEGGRDEAEEREEGDEAGEAEETEEGEGKWMFLPPPAREGVEVDSSSW